MQHHRLRGALVVEHPQHVGVRVPVVDDQRLAVPLGDRRCGPGSSPPGRPAPPHRCGTCPSRSRRCRARAGDAASASISRSASSSSAPAAAPRWGAAPPWRRRPGGGRRRSTLHRDDRTSTPTCTSRSTPAVAASDDRARDRRRRRRAAARLGDRDVEVGVAVGTGTASGGGGGGNSPDAPPAPRLLVVHQKFIFPTPGTPRVGRVTVTDHVARLSVAVDGTTYPAEEIGRGAAYEIVQRGGGAPASSGTRGRRRRTRGTASCTRPRSPHVAGAADGSRTPERGAAGPADVPLRPGAAGRRAPA